MLLRTACPEYECVRYMNTLLFLIMLVAYYVPNGTDKITGMAKGSAFIKFETREGALQCVEAAEVSSASAVHPLTVQGRKCRADLAVDRGEAKRLREEEHTAGRDKRNLYLANEGLLVDSAVSFKRHGDEQ